MKVKRFIGENTKEVMNKVSKELGKEAIILHTRTIKKPKFFGLMKKTEVEVIAALDDVEKQKKKNNNNNDNLKLDLEIKKLNESMKYIIENTDMKKAEKEKSKEDIPEELMKFVDNLKKNGVKDEVARNLIKDIDRQVNLEGKNYEDIKDIIKLNIKATLEEPEPIDLTEGQKIVFLWDLLELEKLQLAKLASDFKLNKKKEVGLITADTYRIAAVEQLKIYGDILEIPVKVMYEIKGIYESLSKLKDKDIILIDTAGRSHKNEKQMEELKELIYTVKNKEIFLVLNIGMDIENIVSVVNQYDFVDDFKIIFTKADESENLGNILNAKNYIDKKLSYITTGQNVPDDIEVIDVEKISAKLIGASCDE